MPDHSFTVVFSSFDATDVHLARNALALEHIQSFIDNEHLTQVQPFYANAVGGIQLRVATKDAKRALAIINRIEEGRKKVSRAQAKCPHCGGHRSRAVSMNTAWLLATLFFIGIPFLFYKRKKCLDCGHLWNG